ncbi:MAG: sulfatase, partial [Phycisphaerales bacterium]
MKPQLPVCAILTAGLLPGAPAPAAEFPSLGDRPNIIFIFADDHAAQAISAYGSGLNHTPNIDRIAHEGALFRNCFVTNSISAPSRAVILTGKFSHHNGVLTNAESFDGSQQTFPKLLQKAGYRTAMIGKWHLKSDPTGFDYWEVLQGQGPYYNPPMKTAAGVNKHTGYTTDIITDLALDWLKEQSDAGRPFLLMCQHKAPHRNWQPGPDHISDFDDIEFPEPPTLFDDYEGRASGAKNQEMTIARHFYPSDAKLEAPGNLTEEQRAVWDAAYGPKNEAFLAASLQGDDLTRWRYQRYIKDYLRSIASVDDNVGRILDYLDESGLAENTIVIYSSDQGFFLGEHGWYDKRWMYEESARMPLLVRWPGKVQPGSEIDPLAQNLDFAPTFLDMAGVDAPADMEGCSLVPLLEGKTPEDWRDSIYYHYYEFPAVHSVPRHYGVRTDRYKLIRYYQLDEWELFDLAVDPDELNSVYDDPEYAPVVEKLKVELTRLQKQYDDTKPEIDIAEHLQKLAQRRAARVPIQTALKLSVRDDLTRTDLDPSVKPLAIGATCIANSPDGVVFAHGGEVFGYCLYLKDGRAHFGVRERGQYREVVAPHPLPMSQPVHVAGVLTADAKLKLYVNGRFAAEANGWILSQAPAEGLDIGRDTRSPVGEYEA